MIAHRRIRRAAECAGILQAIIYDIFLLPVTHNFIPHLMVQGKLQATKIALHKHSLGVSPRFAFGTLLLLATTHNQGGPATSFPGHLDSYSKSLLQRLRQVASEYDRATQSLALTHKFGHRYHSLEPAMIAEIKQTGAIPWPMLIGEPEEHTLLQSRIAHRRRQQQ